MAIGLSTQLFRRLRQRNGKFKAYYDGHNVSSRPAWVTLPSLISKTRDGSKDVDVVQWCGAWSARGIRL